MTETTINNQGSETHVFLFDHSNPNWSPTPEYTAMFLRAITNQWNDRLQMRGYVFLNEVLLALGFERIPQGQTDGWLRKDAPIKIEWQHIDEDSSWEVFITTAGEMYKQI